MSPHNKAENQIIEMPAVSLKYRDRRDLVNEIETLIEKSDQKNLIYTSYFLNKALESLLCLD